MIIFFQIRDAFGNERSRVSMFTKLSLSDPRCAEVYFVILFNFGDHSIWLKPSQSRLCQNDNEIPIIYKTFRLCFQT